VTHIIEKVCHQKKAKLIQVGKDVTWHRIGGDLSQQSLVVNGKLNKYILAIPLLGDHQLENAAVAVAILEALICLGTDISAEAVAQGFSQVNWPGRLQILKHKPMVVVDGAHNAYSMSRLVEAVKGLFTYDRCFVIFGTSCDKDISGMARELAPFAYHITATCSCHPRAASTSLIATEFAKLGIEVGIAKNVSQALSRALAVAKNTDLILVSGSLFVVAEALKFEKERACGLVNKE
jgi:dihydrofolate synthase/folylpolyglutamate synthase